MYDDNDDGIIPEQPSEEVKPKVSRKLRPNTPLPAPEIVGRCPVCGAVVIDEGDRYICNKFYDEGCRFRIYRDRLKNAGKNEITPSEMGAMLQGSIIPLRGLVNRHGETYSAGGRLVNDDDWGWTVKFDPSYCPPCLPLLYRPQHRRMRRR